MTNQSIRDMLKELIMRIDYDIYKETFVYPDMDDEDNKIYMDDLVEIVRKHTED